MNTSTRIPDNVRAAVEALIAPFGGLDLLLPPPEHPRPAPLRVDKTAARTFYLGGISSASLDRLLASGELAHVKIGTRVLLDVTDIDRFVRKCRRTTMVHKPGRPKAAVVAARKAVES